jgi:thioester reductase-like protein
MRVFVTGATGFVGQGAAELRPSMDSRALGYGSCSLLT